MLCPRVQLNLFRAQTGCPIGLHSVTPSRCKKRRHTYKQLQAYHLPSNNIKINVAKVTNKMYSHVEKQNLLPTGQKRMQKRIVRAQRIIIY